MQRSSINNFTIAIFSGILLCFLAFSYFDPVGWQDNTTLPAADEQLSYAKLVAFEPQTNKKSILAYENGECGSENTAELKRKLVRKKDSPFFGIPLSRGIYGEYIHLVYVSFFEKVMCDSKVYYRARMDVNRSIPSCHYLKKLKACGSDLMERRVYKNMVNRMESLGLGSAGDFKPRRTIKQKHCNCEY